MFPLNLYQHLGDNSWRIELETEFTKDYFKELEHKLEEDDEDKTFPPRDLIFHAFNKTPLDKVKVVILGQDPYPTPGNAMGLAFSVPRGCGFEVPPSLQNIYKLLTNEYPHFKTPNHGDLTAWAKRGVFLLNTVLTFQAKEPDSQPDSHSKYGWQTFTDQVISIISEKRAGVVFLLFGENNKTNLHRWGLVDDQICQQSDKTGSLGVIESSVRVK
ncbi:LOW QUALITY PROTEIN: uracil-DNA glycosylase-like [Argopecten irradians]|uniref:LOW QUALITY PROTEIN: uracil-DNA glycosylase-like n=1 Tax=Argopecten irradians TaxID=31199 RepID=UPI003714D076